MVENVIRQVGATTFELAGREHADAIRTSTAFYRHIGYEERARIDVRGVGLILFELGVRGKG